MKIAESVAEKIATSGAKVTEIVIDKLANAEINRRVDMIAKAIGRLDTLKKEFKKINKPDTKYYTDGKPVETMSEKRYQEIDKAKKAIERIESCVNTALEKNDEESYKKLSEAVGGGEQKEKQEAE